MERKNEIFLIIFLLLILSIFLIILLNYDYFQATIDKNIEIYGFPAIFVFSFLADLLEQPISSEIPAVAGFNLFGLNILYVFLVAVVASYLASMINFYFGRKVLSHRIAGSCSVGKYKKYCKFFYKYGDLALFVASITPVPYVTFVWLSGAFHMKLRNFFVFGLLPKAFRTGFILLLFALIW